jgi:hypothetical protein
MRGKKISNLYIIDGLILKHNELNHYQKEKINQSRNLDEYNKFRNKLIELYGDDVEAFIHISTTNNDFTAKNSYNQQIL